VGALCARAAVLGAWLNVRTNLAGLRNRSAVARILEEGARLAEAAPGREAAVLALAEGHIGA
jgi:glutamate formiminotransferase / formiminotetrahydrofolate cyclodeaminase